MNTLREKLRDFRPGMQSIPAADLQVMVQALRHLLAYVFCPADFRVVDSGMEGYEVSLQKRQTYSGTCYINGHGTRGNAPWVDSSKLWLKCNRAGTFTFESATPGPSDPMDKDSEWFYLPETYGDIHAWIA